MLEGWLKKKKRYGRIKIKYVVEAFVRNMTTTVTTVDTVCPLQEVVSTVIPFLDLDHSRGFNYSPLYHYLESQSTLCAMSKTRPLFFSYGWVILFSLSFYFELSYFVCVCVRAWLWFPFQFAYLTENGALCGNGWNELIFLNVSDVGVLINMNANVGGCVYVWVPLSTEFLKPVLFK